MNPQEPLSPYRFFKNGNGFSTGHYELGHQYYMIDVDRLKITAELSVSQENRLFVEFDISFNQIEITALFSLKHQQVKLSNNPTVADFNQEIADRVLLEMARRLNSRLFLVFHGNTVKPPFEIQEIDINSGKAIGEALITDQTREAWQNAWCKLGLKRA